MTLAFPTLRLTPCRGRDTVIPFFLLSVHRNHPESYMWGAHNYCLNQDSLD